MWRTVKQVFKEYWLAFVAGVLWAAYVGGLEAINGTDNAIDFNKYQLELLRRRRTRYFLAA
jgi:hypothetical protein